MSANEANNRCLPIMSSNRIKDFILEIQVQTSHKLWVPMYRVREYVV